MSKISLQSPVSQHETTLVPYLTKSVGVVGSKSLPYSLADKVGLITEDLIKHKYHIATGGAIGADQFVMERLLRLACPISAPGITLGKITQAFPSKSVPWTPVVG